MSASDVLDAQMHAALWECCPPHYRLAHAIDARADRAQDCEAIALYASMISSRGKVLSGAELHHKCRIGKRFVLDHGIGTVLGESSSIGDDCYLLGGVTLGARGIANNPKGKRHLSIGNRVQVGAFSRIFGAVSIGDDVFIGPHCTITEDIPAGSRVTLRTSVQIVERKMRTPLTHRLSGRKLMVFPTRDGTAISEPAQGDAHEI